MQNNVIFEIVFSIENTILVGKIQKALTKSKIKSEIYYFSDRTELSIIVNIIDSRQVKSALPLIRRSKGYNEQKFAKQLQFLYFK